ncbi:MAG TPA: phage terminase small subunit P27 family [Bryobacteraceae bacterium]|nr:phage terminase small subunit P27 family [Bryobacteraceae bacterium]
MSIRRGSRAKELDGNPGKRPIGGLRPPPGVPDRPVSLQGEARAEWDRIVPVLDSMGVLSILDRAVIADHCEAWGQICRINAELAGLPSVIEGRRGGELVKDVRWSVLNALRQRFHKSCELLGLAPSPRGRLDVPDRGLDEDPHGLLD